MISKCVNQVSLAYFMNFLLSFKNNDDFLRLLKKTGESFENNCFGGHRTGRALYAVSH